MSAISDNIEMQQKARTNFIKWEVDRIERR